MKSGNCIKYAEEYRDKQIDEADLKKKLTEAEIR